MSYTYSMSLWHQGYRKTRKNVLSLGLKDLSPFNITGIFKRL